MEPKKLTFYQRMAKRLLESALAFNERVLHRKPVTVDRERRNRFRMSFRGIRQRFLKIPFGIFNKRDNP